MPTYVTLIQFTEQGARNFKDTAKRAAAFRDMSGGADVTVRDIYWTLGAYDGVLVVDAPDEESVTAAMLGLASLGNVRTRTMRAFNESEIGAVVSRAGGGSARSGSGAPSAPARRKGR
jgi:uncharacterized protein with GYD domain